MRSRYITWRNFIKSINSPSEQLVASRWSICPIMRQSKCPNEGPLGHLGYFFFGRSALLHYCSFYMYLHKKRRTFWWRNAEREEEHISIKKHTIPHQYWILVYALPGQTWPLILTTTKNRKCKWMYIWLWRFVCTRVPQSLSFYGPLGLRNHDIKYGADQYRSPEAIYGTQWTQLSTIWCRLLRSEYKRRVYRTSIKESLLVLAEF